MQMHIERDYLWIPVWTGTVQERLSVYQGDQKLFEFVTGTDQNRKPDFCAALPVRRWLGEDLTVDGKFGKRFFEELRCEASLPEPLEERPCIHFTPCSGWLNDPNGLFYKNGRWHLYHQHNPFDVEWGNMSWGHAVSRDLLHWERAEDVMFPDEDGTIFSGCAVCDGKEIPGYPDDAVVYCYTAAGGITEWSKGKSFVQKTAYSIDEGMTLQKKDVVLGHLEAENRDPKIYIQPYGDGWYGVLYLDRDEYGVFLSKDFKTWNMTQKLTLPDAWECPDLFRVPIEGGGEKWMFWTSDGYYFPGEFDGKEFHPDGYRQEAYHSMLPYAAQRFSGTDRVLNIAWLRTAGWGKTYTGMMGIPRELSFVRNNGKFLLRQRLPREWEEQKVCITQKRLTAAPEGPENLMLRCALEKGRAVEVVVEWSRPDADFTLNILGIRCSLNAGLLHIEPVAEWHKGVRNAADKINKEQDQMGEEGTRRVQLPSDMRKMSFLLDAEILELTGDDGLWTAAYEMDETAYQKTDQIQFTGSGIREASCFQSNPGNR